MGLAVNFRIQSGSKDQADLMLPADKGESETSEEDSTGEDGNKFRHRTKESGHFPGKGPKIHVKVTRLFSLSLLLSFFLS